MNAHINANWKTCMEIEGFNYGGKELTSSAPPVAGHDLEERTSRQTSGSCASALCGTDGFLNNTKHTQLPKLMRSNGTAVQ